MVGSGLPLPLPDCRELSHREETESAGCLPAQSGREPLAFIPVLFRSLEPESELEFVKELYQPIRAEMVGGRGSYFRRRTGLGGEDGSGACGNDASSGLCARNEKSMARVGERIAGPLADKEWRKCLKDTTKGR